MAGFFIERPIFAWVIALIIMLAGALSVYTLPVSMYPDVAPPTVEVTAIYPGGSASVIEESVTQVIEQQLKGLDGLLYFSSQSYSYAGYATISLVFENGTDADIAQVQVQNRLQQAMPSLPLAVQQQGVKVTKSGGGYLHMIAFVSEDGSMDAHDIYDYIGTSVVDALSRVPGVGSIREFGSKYALRIWLDPHAVHAYALSIDEIVSAIRAQNAQVSLGALGGAPARDGQQLTATIQAQSRLRSPEQFSAIVLRSEEDGQQLRLGDVARVELGAESYDFANRYNAMPAGAIGITLATGANALQTAAGIQAALDQLTPHFPAGLKAVMPYDSTPFVRMSIKGVIKTLIEAIVLVFVVMYLFLQNFRATLIPTIAVPVVLLGTFGILAALGFSINMLTMFAMVLAIGLLVDDAIVVVENVERIMAEEGLSPLEATRKSMSQITGALVGIGLVLSAVFVPMAFMSGATGVIYRQFSATIVSAMALSVLVAIVLTPALCATLLKPLKKGEHHVAHKGWSGRFFGAFNRGFDRSSEKYQRGVKGIIARPWRFMGIFAALTLLMGLLFMRLPSAFLPNEDQGSIVLTMQGPVGSTSAHMQHVVEAVEQYFMEDETDVVNAVFVVQGYSYAGMGQNMALAFVQLKDWGQRSAEDSAAQLAARAGRAMVALQGADIHVFSPAPIPALGSAEGFSFFLEDIAGHGHEALTAARNQMLAAARSSPLLANMRANGQDDMPLLQVDVDVAKAMAMGLSLDAVNGTLAAAWGSRYVDDFVDRGRVKRVYLQGDIESRMNPEDFQQWSIRNAQGQMVPFSAFATQRWTRGSPRLERFNGVSAMEIQGQPAAGTASGTAMAEIEAIASRLPAGFAVAWTGGAYQQRQIGAQTTLLYALSLLVVFFCLAALYESWTVPTAVLLMAPLGILGAVLANTMRGLERDIYFQVAMLTTVGLTSKNAILIVEFAKANLESGASLVEATLKAVRDRVRPIIMTSLAFGLGVLPLAIASGAGSGAQRAIGTGVLGGMLVGTVLGLLYVPLFFVVVQRLFNRSR